LLVSLGHKRGYNLEAHPAYHNVGRTSIRVTGFH
jgi:hypothetical protein